MNEVATMNKKAENAVTRYNKALSSAQKSAWNVAKVVYETVNSKDFNEMFGSLSEYSKEIGCCKATVSNMVNAYSSYLVLPNKNENPALGLSYSQIVEMRKLNDDEKIECVELYEIDEKTTTKEVREFANDYLNTKKVAEESEEADDEADDEAEDSEEENTVKDDTDIMTIVYKGMEYNITDVAMINDVLSLLSYK